MPRSLLHGPRRSTVASAGLLLGLALASASAASAQQPVHPLHPISTLPLGDPAYVQLDGLARQGCDAAHVSPFRPFLVADIARALRAAAGDRRCALPIVASLEQRFGDAAPSPSPAAPVAAPVDTTVAPDLAAAASARQAVTASAEHHSYVGGAVTAAVTALGLGEFRPLYYGVRSASEGTPPGVGTLRVRGVYDGGPRFVAVSEGFLQSSRRNDPLIRAKTLGTSSAALDFSEAYGNGRLGPVVVSLGRARESWSSIDGEESMILAANVAPFDRVMATGRWGRLEARAMLASLNDVTLDETIDSLPAGAGRSLFHRRLAAHALSFRPTPGTEITLGETMLFSRHSLDDGLMYANVLMPFIVAQGDTGLTAVAGRDNLMLYGAGRAHAGPVVFAGELAVDDFQYGATDRQKLENQLAWRIEASVPISIVNPGTLLAEYRHVNTFTYERPYYTEGYHFYDRSLGSELGPDADLSRVGIESWFGGDVLFAANVGRWRQGAIRIDQRPGQSVNAGKRPYPSTSDRRPAVQSATLGDVSLRLLRVTLPLTARLEAARVQNPGGVAASAQTYVRAQLIATYAFRYP